MVLLSLFWSFVKIGFTSFGGLSMIPLITSEMLSHGWMTAAEVTDIIAIAEMTPGPLGINCATFAGIHAAGMPGAVAASLGVMTPTFTIGALAAFFYGFFKESRGMAHAMVGVRPACIGMILGVTLQLALSNYGAMMDKGIIPFAAVSILDAALLIKWKVSVPKVICLSAALGVALF